MTNTQNYSEFPLGCIRYRGPNSLKCYSSIFENIGCFAKGRELSYDSLTTLAPDWDLLNLE